MSKIEQTLLEATKIKPQKANEKDAKYRARLVRASNDLDEDVWAELDETTQEWVNAGVAAINDKTDVIDFPDVKAKSKSKAKASKASTKKKTEKKTAKKAEVDTDKPKRGGAAFYRKLMVKDKKGMKSLKWDTAALLEKVHEAGYKLSPGSAEVTYYETKSTIKVLQEAGQLD